jgi:hypothetical protein
VQLLVSEFSLTLVMFNFPGKTYEIKQEKFDIFKRRVDKIPTFRSENAVIEVMPGQFVPFALGYTVRV